MPQKVTMEASNNNEYTMITYLKYMTEILNKEIETFQKNADKIGISTEVKDGKIIIKSNFINYKILTDLIVTAFVIYFNVSTKNLHGYISLLIFLYLFIMYSLFWYDFETINVITIDFLKKSIAIKSRSVLRRIILGAILQIKSEYYFNEIKCFGTKTNGAGRASDLRRFVFVSLKNGKKIYVTNFYKKEHSLEFADLLKTLLADRK